MSLLFKVQAANLSNLTAEHQRLAMEKEISDNETRELRGERDNLNWTLEVILKFDNFPVKDYCPKKRECFIVLVSEVNKLHMSKFIRS